MQNSRRRRRHPQSRKGAARLPSRRGNRPPDGSSPAEKIEPGETPAGALRRELEEELGVEVVPGDELYRLVTAPERGGIELIFLRALLAPESGSGLPRRAGVPLGGARRSAAGGAARAGPPGLEFLTNFQRPIQFFPPPAR
ncbi:MAG: NUDIX domain-containing protein [Lentisphaeria bacterium]|nr:MAG: NUDIX domain-containing protein [Lentisphaeria bacterium]